MVQPQSDPHGPAPPGGRRPWPLGVALAAGLGIGLSEVVTNCRRSTSGVTVVVGGNGFKEPAGLQAMADLTNAAWTAASRG